MAAMQTLNYIGCKKTIFKTLLRVIEDCIPDLQDHQIADIFAGTGYVAFQFLPHVKKVIANDIEHYSTTITSALLTCNYSPAIEHQIEECNALEPRDGLITEYYSPAGEAGRMFFTTENARKCDAVRQYIESHRDNRTFLLASLLTSIDKVANTTSVYGAYLKEFKSSALAPFKLLPIHTCTSIPNRADNEVFNVLAEELVVSHTFDIVYMDPPYNNRQYGANYSPLNFICDYDTNLIPQGKTGLTNYTRSRFSQKREAQQAFEELIGNLKCNYLVMSYNNEGLLPFDFIEEKLSALGSLQINKFKYRKYNASSNVATSNVYEYIWLVDTHGTKGELAESEITMD